MRKKVVIIHTSFVSVDDMKRFFGEIIPEADINHIVDDSLLEEVMKNNGITPGIIKRLTHYVQMAESIGADAIFNQCSSVGEAAEIASKSVNIPVLRVDQAMANKAILSGTKIGVVATVSSTLGPTIRLLQKAARKAGEEIEIVEGLVDGALDILLKKRDKHTHNQLVLDKVRSLDGHVDVIVLAQGSMIVLVPELKNIKTPVLTSPELGVKMMRQVLGL
jgi:Asp/Glu/hydantoin racemase